MNEIDLLKKLILREEETETLPQGFEEDPMGFILKKYPGLNTVMEYMMTKDFREFVDAIFVVAPKPTTFKVLLHNGQYFFLQFMGDTYQATVLGKNYYLKSIGEKERCMLAIARLLRYGSPLKTKGPEGGETGTGGEEAGGLGDLGGETGGETGGEEAGGEEAGGEALEESKILELLLKESIMEASKKNTEAEENYTDTLQKLVDRIKDLSEYSPKVTGSGSKYRITFMKGVVKAARELRWSLAKIIASKGGSSYQVNPDHVTGDNLTPSIIWNKGKKKITIELKGYTPGASTTSDKEGLTVLFCYSDIKDPITEDNFDGVVKKLKSLLNGNLKHLGGTKNEETGKVEIEEYFDNIGPSKNVIDALNQSLSQALPIIESYPGKTVTRAGIFNEYKTLVAKTLKIPADKWCPADLFILVNAEDAQTILDKAKAMAANPDMDELEFLELVNGVFNNEFGGVAKPITGVSLKYEQAQLGKAKSYLDREFSDVEDTYNVTDEEQKLRKKDRLEMIEKFRKNIKSILGKRTEKSPKIIYTLKDPKVEEDKIIGKFAGLKAINFFFKNVYNIGGANKIDNALLDLTKFALSLTTLNPTFFKIKAVGGGKPGTVKEFSQGVTVTIKKNQDIEIIDDPGYKGVKILLPIKRTDRDGQIETTTIQVSAKSNGNTQGTIELEQK